MPPKKDNFEKPRKCYESPSSDAFSMLMSQSQGNASNSSSQKYKKRKTPPSSVKLVKCPICSKSLPDARLNTHLDTCVRRQDKIERILNSETPKLPGSNQIESTIVTTINRDLKNSANLFCDKEEGTLKVDDSNEVSSTVLTQPIDTKKSSFTPRKSSRNDHNAFSHMMKQSALMFSSPNGLRKQYFQNMLAMDY